MRFRLPADRHLVTTENNSQPRDSRHWERSPRSKSVLIEFGQVLLKLLDLWAFLLFGAKPPVESGGRLAGGVLEAGRVGDWLQEQTIESTTPS